MAIECRRQQQNALTSARKVAGFDDTSYLSMDFHKKCPNIKFHGNLTCGIRADTHRRTDMTKLTGALREGRV